MDIIPSVPSLIPVAQSLLGELRRNFDADTDNAERARRLLFNFNRQALLEALRTLRIDEAIVRYCGCGDSGTIDDVDLGATPAAGATLVELAVLRYRSSRTTEPRIAVEVDVMSLRNAMCLLCEEAIEVCGHDGYENGDGGEGTLTIDVANGKLHLEHSDFYTESDTTEHEL